IFGKAKPNGAGDNNHHGGYGDELIAVGAFGARFFLRLPGGGKDRIALQRFLILSVASGGIVALWLLLRKLHRSRSMVVAGHEVTPGLISRSDGNCRFYCAGKENKPLGQIKWGIRGGVEVDGVLAALLWESALWAGFARANRAPWSNGCSRSRREV